MKKSIQKLLSAFIAICLIASSVIIGVSATDTSFVKKGIDVSAWQGEINWETVQSRGVDFAILRCWCYGKDVYFEDNYEGATENGVDVGIYTYMYAQTVEDARAEALNTLSVLDGRPLDYPVVLDVEDECLSFIDTDTLCDCIEVELEIFAEAGYIPCIYTFPSFMWSYLDMDRLEDYDMWLAWWPSFEKEHTDYSDVDPSWFGYDYAMWQFTSDGDGEYYGMESSRLDMDYCYKDYSQLTKAKGNRRNAGNYMINACESTAGWQGDYDTVVTTSKEHTQGNKALKIYNPEDQAQIIGESSHIGALARCQYDEAMDLSEYEYIAFEYYLSHDFDDQESYLELNFCTETDDDGFQLKIDITDQDAGWHSVMIEKSEIPVNPKATFEVEPSWSQITNLRWSWWNDCARDDEMIEIILDDLRALNFGEPNPGGNILKVTYSNDDSSVPGYKFLDLSNTTIGKGWSLSYDVYLENDAAGIGGLDLDDKYETFSRDDVNFFDQNNVAGHPKTDISEYAYKQWYHREILLPDNWDGEGYENFYTMIAFDGGFVGDAVAYFDNIKLTDADGEVVDFFFLDGGEEYEYVNDATLLTGGDMYEYTNYDGVNASVVSYESVFGPSATYDLTLDFTKDGEEWDADGHTYALIDSNGKTISPTERGESECVFNVKAGTYKPTDNGEELAPIKVTADTSKTIEYVTLSTDGISTDPAVTIKVTGNDTKYKDGDIVRRLGNYGFCASDPAYNDGKCFFTWSDGTEGDTVSVTDLDSIPTVEVQRILWGDANVDSDITSIDALMVLRVATNRTQITGNPAEIIRVSGGQKASSTDALLILQKSVNLIDKFPVQK